MVTSYTKDEPLAIFVEKAKAENQKELNEILELQRLLEEIGGEAEHPQLYRITVRSNW